MKKLFLILFSVLAVYSYAEISTRYRLLIISSDMNDGHRRLLEKKYNKWVNVASNMPSLSPSNMITKVDSNGDTVGVMCISKERAGTATDDDWNNFFSELPPPVARKTICVGVDDPVKYLISNGITNRAIQ